MYMISIDASINHFRVGREVFDDVERQLRHIMTVLYQVFALLVVTCM